MAAKLTRLTHKIATQLHLVAEGCTIFISRARRPVRKIMDTPSYDKLHGTQLSLQSWQLNQLAKKFSSENSYIKSLVNLHPRLKQYPVYTKYCCCCCCCCYSCYCCCCCCYCCYCCYYYYYSFLSNTINTLFLKILSACINFTSAQRNDTAFPSSHTYTRKWDKDFLPNLAPKKSTTKQNNSVSPKKSVTKQNNSVLRMFTTPVAQHSQCFWYD
jgi:hypothetical protein